MLPLPGLTPGVRFLYRIKRAFTGREQSLVSLLKPAIICPFRGIVTQVRIFDLKRAKMPFSARKFLLEIAFLSFSALWRWIWFFLFTIRFFSFRCSFGYLRSYHHFILLNLSHEKWYDSIQFPVLVYLYFLSNYKPE
jgi:hypothetical protein